MSNVKGNTFRIAEAYHAVQIIPVYASWHAQQVSKGLGQATEVGPNLELGKRTVQKDKLLKTGILRKTLGQVSISMDILPSYAIKLDINSPNSISMPIKLRYLGQSNAPPPKITKLSARLYIFTKSTANLPPHLNLSSTYRTSLTVLKAATPSTSTSLWEEESHCGQLCSTMNLTIPLNLPPTAGSSKIKGENVLLPSFETLLISRSYDVEVKIDFENGGEVLLHCPIIFVAKPGTSAGETELDARIHHADSGGSPTYESILNANSESWPDI